MNIDPVALALIITVSFCTGALLSAYGIYIVVRRKG